MTEIAYRQEIETGPATVRMCVDNTVEEYEAEITEIDLGSENTNKILCSKLPINGCYRKPAASYREIPARRCSRTEG